MRYKIVAAETIEQLELRVNELIDDSWEPEGGMIISKDGEKFYQTMMQYDFDDYDGDDEF
ncbi:MAG: DUF1737 domain-containing protein [Ignavibacteria bacterium]|nr:DUF1737 domain-containing protein [Ignavibacteria bacterium]HCN37515.1 hypothetical protein [Bacteroidota bacterium]